MVAALLCGYASFPFNGSQRPLLISDAFTKCAEPRALILWRTGFAVHLFYQLSFSGFIVII